MTEAAKVDLAQLPALPRDEEGPVFAAPWQAQAFAMTLKLYESGHFSWPEWARYLSAQIKRAQDDGGPDLGDTYYLHWLTALERIVTDKGLLTGDSLVARKAQWRAAMECTPHGEPIALQAEIVSGKN